MDIQAYLNEEQIMIWHMAQRFSEEKLAPMAAIRDQQHQFPEELVPSLGELGFLGIKVSVDDGGSGADMVSYSLALSAMARHCASAAVTMAVCNLAADVLSRFGNTVQKKQFLHPYLTGQIGPGSFCLSESGAGSDAAGLISTAEKKQGKYILNGSKQWITNGGYAPFHLVFARTDPSKGSRGLSCFIVEKDTPGLSIGPPERKMGLKSSNTVALTFENCEIPEENLLGELGQGYSIALSGLDGGRIGIASQCIGISEAAISEGVNYAMQRKAFGQVISQFQASQFAVADSVCELEQSWLLTLRAAKKRDKGEKSAKESSMAKLFASESCQKIVDRMLQLHGGYGYVEEYPIERLYRDARVTRIYEGTSEVQRIVIAREVIRS